MVSKAFALILMSSILLAAFGITPAQAVKQDVSFKKIKIMVPEGDSFAEKSAVVSFREDVMEIVYGDAKNTVIMKYTDITGAEYSYSKAPRWKTGLGLGAASVAFPPLLLVAIPLGFTKHRRHWLTIRTQEDFGVLKLSKSNRKMIIPTLETRTGVTVSAVGDDK